MRIRSKPWALPELEACPFYVQDAHAMYGKWQSLFPKAQPLRLELGCGKGGFISQEAPANPTYNYIAIDIKKEMLVLAKRKIEQAYQANDTPTDNIRICLANIVYFWQFFSTEDRVDRIYINFCNPWSHNKHKKRRLTHPRQLAQYREVLDGEIWFKTDDDGLFDESLGYFAETGYTIKYQTRDLHANPIPQYYETEHEQMFQEEGKTIKFLIAEPAPDPPEEHLAELLQEIRKGNAAYGLFDEE